MQAMKVALVTGSGKRRVGRFVIEALAARGYACVVHYHTAAADAAEAVAELRARGAAAVALPADLTEEKAARGLVEAAVQEFGRLDVLVNCASVWQAKPLEEVTAHDLRFNFQVNILGTFLCAQQAGLAMIRQPEGGCIINFGDWAEARPYLHYAAYFASKGAVPALTRCLAVELGTRSPRVRVNCILPGPLLFQPDLPEAEKQQAIGATLAQRSGQPENIVQAVLFFIDNDFTTGACLTVDGGRTIYAGGN
jgi:pteridine reductase